MSKKAKPNKLRYFWVYGQFLWDKNYLSILLGNNFYFLNSLDINITMIVLLSTWIESRLLLILFAAITAFFKLLCISLTTFFLQTINIFLIILLFFTEAFSYFQTKSFEYHMYWYPISFNVLCYPADLLNFDVVFLFFQNIKVKYFLIIKLIDDKIIICLKLSNFREKLR